MAINQHACLQKLLLQKSFGVGDARGYGKMGPGRAPMPTTMTPDLILPLDEGHDP